MKKTNIIYSLLKGILFAVGITVIGVAALALFVKDTEGLFLKFVILAIKILSIVIGTVIAAKGIRKRGALVGAIVAFAYWIICLLLSLFVDPLEITLKLFGDLFFTCVMGSVAGILTINALK